MVIRQHCHSLLEQTRELDSARDWEWRQPGSPFMVKNMGNLPVIVTINEGRE